MAQKRKPISQKIRFEVFKRDNFTCQYCGRMAPNVVLEVDHINPVKNGGDNDIMNLITSCFECNRGKGKRKLSATEEIQKQQEQLKMLNEKRKQLQMLIDWKKELEKFEEDEVDKIEELLSTTNHCFSDYGRANCKKDIKKYGFEEVYESTKISIEQYYDPNDDKSPTKVFNYIGRICAVRKSQKDNPNLRDINYLIRIATNNFHYVNKIKLKSYLTKKYKKEDFESLKTIFCESRNWTELNENLEVFYGEENGS